MMDKAAVKSYKLGLRHGVPIGAGYFAVSFSLGITASLAGVNAIQGFKASLFTVASAGEYAGFTTMASGGSYV
nr:branched-chain amino acid ABC transporter permease [Lachnospiraceae bacterium]